MRKQSGDILGVFSREDIGTIDLVWGDVNGGLQHIISKHIGDRKSFASVEEAQNEISDIIENGEIIFENGDKAVISKDNKTVTLRKNYRKKGKKIADKNWILTAYDETKADGTSAISDTNQGQAAPPTNVSSDKITNNSSPLQENPKNSDDVAFSTSEESQLATGAAIMALTDSGIEVVEATDEMAEAVLGNAANGFELMAVEEAKRRADAIESLAPINVEANTKTKEELKEEYKLLPSVEKDGRIIEFYVSAFKKIYKEGGLFGQIIPQLDNILRQSVLAYSEIDNRGGLQRPDGTIHKEHANVLSFDNYVGKVSINGERYYVRITVQQSKSSENGTHSFFVSNVNVYENPTESQTIPITSRGTTDYNGIVDTKLQQFFDYANGNLKNPEFQIFGGNSGYVGYSMSRRAAEAREEGRYPKTDFKKVYRIPQSTLDALVEAELIDNTEWHHTSMYGNRTTFYGWNEPWYGDAYTENKKEIDRLAKEQPFNVDAIQAIFDNAKAKDAYENAQRVAKAEAEIRRAFGDFDNANRLANLPEEYTASNGVVLVTNGTTIPYDWAVFYKGSKAWKSWRKKAAQELKDILNEKNKSNPTYEQWRASNHDLISEIYAKHNATPIEFLRTPQGTVYGWTDGKRIYLTKEGMNPETPIHEYTHLWARAMMQNNAEGWQSIKDLLRDTPIWQEVVNDTNYANIRDNEDAIASEALSRLSGRQGAKKMQEMARRLINEGNPNTQSLIDRMRQALQEFWNWVGINLFGIKSFDRIDQVTDRVLWDMLNGTDLGNLAPNQNELMIIGEQGASALDRADEATHRMDNLNIAREMETTGKDAKTIRMATGWERGADGKWRYEIGDYSIKEEKIDFITAQLDYKNTAAILLKDLLKDAQGLFVAYPELRNMRVVIKKDSSVIGQGELQWYDAVYDRQIVLNDAAIISHFAKSALERYGKADVGIIRIKQGYNPTTKEKFTNEAEKQEALKIYIEMMNEALLDYYRFKSRNKDIATSILTHEIQHAIQFIEGFASGSNIERFADLRGAVLDSINFMTNGDLLKGSAISDSQSLRDALNKTIPYTDISLKDGYANNLQKVAHKYGYDNIDALVDDFENMPSAFEQYHRTAGEVESRNAQKRMDMSNEQRRETLLADTEDVAREDQIFLMENSGISAMGTTVTRRKADIAVKLQGRDVSPTQLKVLDAFTTDANNITIDVVDANGEQRSITLKQGQDNRAGVKHSVLRHYETAKNSYTAEDILLIPQVVEQGERKQDGKKVSYKLDIGGVKYTVTTDIKGNHEEFTNFFTNRKPIVEEQGSSNTANQHEQPQQSVSANEGSDNISPLQENGELFKRGDIYDYKTGDKITMQNVNVALYREHGPYGQALKQNVSFRGVVLGWGKDYQIDAERLNENLDKALIILEEYKEHLTSLKSNATTPAQKVIDEQIAKIDASMDWANQTKENPSLFHERWHNAPFLELLRPIAEEVVNAEFPDNPSVVAQQTAEALGVDIEIDETLPAKGSYNTRTGRIRINPHRHSSPQDIERTILHEVIGHGGLQALSTHRMPHTKEVLTKKTAQKIAQYNF